MTKEKMERRASDNVYLHKDFHGALSTGLDFLERKYGPESVREYLWQFARSFYSPLTREMLEKGLQPLKEHIEKTYSMEDGRIRTTISDDELLVEIEACPAVMHMRREGYPVARQFRETTRTVNEAICEGTPYAAELLEYEEETGRSVMRFSRRKP